MIFDIHIHTTISSCSRVDVHELIETAGRIGLDGICITDHGSMAISRYIREGRQPNGLIVIIGMEYETVAIAAHPCWKARPVSESIFQKGLCPVIETQNGRNAMVENLKA